MIAEHLDAVTARLEMHVGLAGRVFEVVRQNPDGEFVRDNYLVVTAGMPVTGGDRQARSQVHRDNAIFVFKVRAVGVTSDVVLRMLDAVSQQWLGWVPSVVGRECSSMRYPDQNVTVEADTSVRPPLFFADVEYTLRSHFVNGS